MTWPTARTALERVLSLPASEVSIDLSGGEPLLNPATLRRAVRFVETYRAVPALVRTTVTTNGTRLTARLLAFLFEHGLTVRISFDGVAAAQRERGGDTFRTLDRLLDRLRTRHPADFARHVTIHMTVLGSTIRWLADGVEYLLAKGVRRIEVGSRSTFDRDFQASSREELERQVDPILLHSVEHWRHTGEIPVVFLAGPPLQRAGAPVRDLLCAAPVGRALGVDTEGRAWGCALFAPSLRSLPPLAAEAARALDLGGISAPSFPRRLAALPRRAGTLRIFTDRLAKRSSYGACAECRFVADCHVCPAAICHIPGNRDPDLVPDFICAFNYATLAARERFDEMTGGEVSAAWCGEMKAALARLEAAVRGLSAGTAASPPSGPARDHERPTHRAP